MAKAGRSADPHTRLLERLGDCLTILDRQREAIRAGRSADVAELGGLERQAVADIVALEKTVRSAAASSEEEHLRKEVLARNQRNRVLLAEELVGIRKMLTARRARLGTPSVFAHAGEARLVDLRT